MRSRNLAWQVVWDAGSPPVIPSAVRRRPLAGRSWRPSYQSSQQSHDRGGLPLSTCRQAPDRAGSRGHARSGGGWWRPPVLPADLRRRMSAAMCHSASPSTAKAVRVSPRKQEMQLS